MIVHLPEGYWILCVACPDCNREVRLFLQLKKIEFRRNLEKNNIFTVCRDRHGIGKYLIVHVTGFPRDSHATRDKITLNLILSRDACVSRERRATYAWRTRPVCYDTLIYLKKWIFFNRVKISLAWRSRDARVTHAFCLWGPGKCAAEKLKNVCSSSLWTCLHHMVIFWSQNKITDFLMILDLGMSF